MENTFNYIDELIGKYLAGEATPSEIEQVERWERISATNKHYVSQLRHIFEKAASIKEWQQFDQDAAWNKMKARLHQKEGKSVSLNTQSKSNVIQFNWVWRVAASVVLVLGISFYLYQRPSIINNVEVATETKSKEDTLPDGSDVFLNKKTKLVYAYDKSKKQHSVKLKGEAYFTIKHDEKKKFLIEAEGAFIRDIGTVFSVKAYPESDKIEVVVKEGEVEFFTETDSGVFLRAGAKGVFDKKTKKFSLEQPDNNAFAYKTKFFSFNNQDLASVIHDLNDVYDKRIVLSDKLKHCRLTVTFNNEEIEEIARVLADTYGLSLKENGNEIILDGAGCEK